MPSSTVWWRWPTAAEETGYDSVWVMDHFYQLPPMGGPSQPMLDAYTLLGTLATQTWRVRLGTMVTGVTYRNPAHLAKIVTTLDVLSAGRAISVSAQRGTTWSTKDWASISRRTASGWTGWRRHCRSAGPCYRGFALFDGRYYRIHEARNIPRPVQSGGPPILIGGGGEKRTLRFVARYADMMNIFGDAATVAHKVDVLHRHCEAVGRDPADITVSRLSTLMLTANAEETASTRDFLRQVTGEEPTTSDIGTPDELVARVEELAAAGVQYFIFNMPTGSPETVRRWASC